MNNTFRVVIVLVAVCIVALGGFFLFKNNSSWSQNKQFAATSSAVQNGPVSLYFNNFQKDPAANCVNVFPVERTSNGVTPQGTLAMLFAGPTADEIKNGYSSMFSAQTKDLLKNFFVKDNTAYIDLNDERDLLSGAGSSCGSAAFFSATQKTIQQFDGFKKIIFAINGNPTLFYEWMQIGCDDSNNYCDDAAFRSVGK